MLVRVFFFFFFFFFFFHFNILTVNVLGSFVLGVFSILSAVWNLDTKYFLLIADQILWLFDITMSSFALESTNLLDNKQFSIFGLNILSNVGLSLGAIIVGRILASTLMKIRGLKR